MSPQEGIVRAILNKEKSGGRISHELKVKFRNCLEWVIANEKDSETLAWAYNLRGEISAGLHYELCED